MRLGASGGETLDNNILEANTTDIKSPYKMKKTHFVLMILALAISFSFGGGIYS
jgi:hypothetical protein